MSSPISPRQRRSSILSPILHPSNHQPVIHPNSRKARPTVSITNSNASCITSSDAILSTTPFPPSNRGFIPFPTSPDSESDYIHLLRRTPLNQKLLDSQSRTSPRASRVELRHRRSLARLAQSPLVRKDAQKGKLNTKDAGATKRPRPCKHDVQLLEIAYRSVAWQLARTRSDGSQDIYGGRADPEMRQVMEAQDRLFVERLCEVMAELGYPPLPTMTSSASLSDSELSHDSPFLCDPLPPRESISMALVSPEDPPVLTMPQLVATIMLRRGDRSRRAASRERFSPYRDVLSPKGSPLARDLR